MYSTTANIQKALPSTRKSYLATEASLLTQHHPPALILISHNNRRSPSNTTQHHAHHNKSNPTTSTPNQHTKGHRPPPNQHNPKPARPAPPIHSHRRHDMDQVKQHHCHQLLQTPNQPPKSPRADPPHTRRGSATPPSTHVLAPHKTPPRRTVRHLWACISPAINSPSSVFFFDTAGADHPSRAPSANHGRS